MKKISGEVFDRVTDMFGDIATLPEDKFLEAMEACAVLALGTLYHTQGEQFYNGFLDAERASTPQLFIRRVLVERH